MAMDDDEFPKWRYFDREGNPIDVLDWARIAAGDHTVGHTRVSDAVCVSTIWTGVRIGSVTPPLIFETVVVGGWFDRQGEKYATEAEAVAGHMKWVERATRAVKLGAVHRDGESDG